jgi:putative spermidine/putrescine transport system substrate-binding protein
MNLKWAEPKEGAYQVPTLAAITKTKHAYWSQVLVNHLLDPAVQSEFAECGHYAPTNRTVKLSERIASKVVHGDAQVERLMKLQWDTIKPVAAEVGSLFLQAVQTK